ncbi:2Fe-2S ferredoxin [Gloeothece citriformis PCC 7424]|uniref:2Fe-2S ferredoxin n=1 Tax=Gloeothece citriformis (strain PCC 7424) TaxID=65393 RepID=B7K7V5_GLOC7|nr:(2Fe-2S) ferredoxin domain-containing protein [Gloeothece citriformis]ACK71151.1 2Fe-2S ferredoxin [Gloeothece citriformis PCC 7424]
MKSNNPQRCVMVCQHSSCIVQGSAKILLAFQLADLPDDTFVMASGCQGQCSTSPTVRIIPDETWYYRVQLDDVNKIVEQHLKAGQPVTEKLHPRFHPPQYPHQS